MEDKKKCGCGCGKDEEFEKVDSCDCGCDCEDGCDCGCEDEGLVDLVDDSGRKIKFFHLGTIEYKGKYYAAFQPAEEVEGLENGEMVIFEVGEDKGEESSLLPIEDEAFLDEVYEEFCRVMDEEGEEE